MILPGPDMVVISPVAARAGTPQLTRAHTVALPRMRACSHFIFSALLLFVMALYFTMSIVSWLALILATTTTDR